MIRTLLLLVILVLLFRQVKWTRVRQISALHVGVALTLLWAARTKNKGRRTTVLNSIAVLALIYHGLRFFR